MGVEWLLLRRRSAVAGPSPSDYELSDSLASLNPLRVAARLVLPTLLPSFVLRRGKLAGPALAIGVGAAGIATVADLTLRATEVDPVQAPSIALNQRLRDPHRLRALAEQGAAIGGAVAIGALGMVACATFAEATVDEVFWKRRLLPDAGTGIAPLLFAIVGWDFIYYWNHRFMHQMGFLWAIHVIHHSSERFNLSTGVRLTVTDGLGVFVPYGLLALAGIRPEVISRARDINVTYQWALHTGLIPRLPNIDPVLNTPSNHRVHHGANRQYLDRNHGSITVLWDRIFGTYEPEHEPVRYGMPTNVDTFHPVKLMTFGHRELFGNIVRSRSWRERLSFLFRSPAWAASNRRPPA